MREAICSHGMRTYATGAQIKKEGKRKTSRYNSFDWTPFLFLIALFFASLSYGFLPLLRLLKNISCNDFVIGTHWHTHTLTLSRRKHERKKRDEMENLWRKWTFSSSVDEWLFGKNETKWKSTCSTWSDRHKSWVWVNWNDNTVFSTSSFVIIEQT